LDLAALVLDPRCAIDSRRAKQLLAVLQTDAGAPHLTQDAKVEADGRVLIRLVNLGKAPVTMPISWHPKLPAFSALAEDEEHHMPYELELPKLGVAGDAADGGAHIARIVLLPGGFARARVTISNAINKRIAPSCDDGSCAPPKLAAGKYTLHIGQLVCDVE